MLLGVLNQRHLFIRDQVCRGTNQLELRGRGTLVGTLDVCLLTESS